MIFTWNLSGSKKMRDHVFALFVRDGVQVFYPNTLSGVGFGEKKILRIMAGMTRILVT
jgi:hypothetical protein